MHEYHLINIIELFCKPIIDIGYTISHKCCIYMDVFLSIILKLKPAFVDWLWPPNKLKGECKLNHMKMIRGKAFMEGRAPSCEANAINATGCNSINS